MTERRLARRFVLGTTLLALATGVLTGVPLERSARWLLEQDLAERADSGAEMLAAALPVDVVERAVRGDAEAGGELREELVDLAEEADVAVANVVSSDGRIVASSDPTLLSGEPDPITLAGGWRLEEVRELDASNSPVRVDPTGTDVVSAVAPVEDAGEVVFVTVRAPATWSRRLRWLEGGIAVAVGVWVLVVALGGALVARRLVAPLEHLAQAARTLAAGGDQRPLPRTGYVELDTLADEFDRMGRAVDARERWLRGLAGAVAHEVRNPAQALRLHVGLLRRQLPADATSRLDTLDAELDLLEVTVTSLLAFAEGAPAERRVTELRPLFTEAAPGAVVDAEGSANLDPVLIGRAVSNLARNAAAAGARNVRVAATRDGEVLRITVDDDGQGFPGDLVDRAFEPFARGRGDGSGLGLALVSAIARAHAGTATIERPGPGGTTVALTLRDV
ncbi:MAG: HAMP domain-containing histidine kinase [Myxococcales bacterium]|nr:HAMP domain-containing histidine kinase [Myxococcales bacterium]